MFASIEEVGFDPAPYRNLDTGERSTSPRFVGWAYSPRAEFVHRPQRTNRHLAAFREEWEAVVRTGDIDLGEFAEQTLHTLPLATDEEVRFARAVLGRLARVLDRPLAEASAVCAANRRRQAFGLT